MSISNPRASTERLDQEHKELLLDKNDAVTEQQKDDNDGTMVALNGLESVDGFHPSSEDAAGLFNRVTFTYVGVYWYRTRNAKTDAELLERPSRSITASVAAAQLEDSWNSVGLHRSFLLAIWKTIRYGVSIYAVFLCMEEVTRVAQPLLLRRLMEYYNIKEGEEFAFFPAMLTSMWFSLLSFITVLIHHPYFHGLLTVGNNVRVGTGVLLYKKALRLSLTSLADTNSGQIIQLLNTDAAKLEQAFLFAHYVWLCPILMIFYTVVLYLTFGFSCIIGFGVMMFIVIFQVYYSYQLGMNRKNIGDRMDARLKVMSELINGMKVIKMIGWEESFSAKIKVLREQEITAVGKSSYYSSLVMGFFFISAKIGLLVYIFACLYFDEVLTTKGVFAASALYNSVRLPFALFLPLGLLFGRELISTSRRINVFFRLHEFSRTTVVKKTANGKEKIANGQENVLAIENSASWNLNDSSSEGVLVRLSDVTSVWYDTVEKEEKKQMKELDENGDASARAETDSSLDIVYGIQDCTLELKSGECYGVIGSVGSGKSSLLLTILAETRISKGNMVTRGKFAYCAQESFIFPGTIRENIVFRHELDIERYQRAVEMCLLEHDFQQLQDGDLTVVGDNGSTLSGGQRARISLARAVYADADIYLLDDPLSAVDAHVGRKLYENVIRGVLADKLVVLVTHQIHFLSTLDSVILMKNNKFIGSGTLEKLRSDFADEFINLQTTNTEERDDVDLDRDRVPESPPPSPLEKERVQFEHVEKEIDGKSIEKSISHPKLSQKSVEGNLEARKSGSVSWMVYWRYTRAVITPLKYGCFLVVCVVITQLLNNFLEWWQNKWLVDYDEWNSSNGTAKEDFRRTMVFLGFKYEVTFQVYEYSFAWITGIVTFLGVARSVWFRNAQLGASRNLHNAMFTHVLNTQSEFFEKNSEGAILNRFSKDIGLTDDMLAFCYFELVFGALTFLGIIGLVVMVRPIVIFACVLIIIAFYYCRRMYVIRSRELKRIEAAARSPLNTLITSTVYGLATIRAYRKESEMIDKFCSLHDVYMSAYNMGILSARWFGICIDLLVSVFVSIVAIVVVLQYKTMTAGEVGLCLMCTVQLSGFFSWIMRQSAELENGMVSIERILEYTELKSEEEMRRPHEEYLDNTLKTAWPTKGEIEFENVCVKYGDTYVLNKLSFTILEGQKIGVVGRTGAGKSTLLKVLFGLKEYCHGQVRIDNIDLDSISLRFRRKGMSIIPQEPTIFTTSIRENLDPYNLYTDADIWSALEQCEMKDVVVREKGLDVVFGQRGFNFSVGQRQLFCLARALLEKSNILVIDEATANVDGATDAAVQKTISDNFRHATVITVAHRLHTIMNSDRIMVFEKGELVEFDKPLTLLSDPSSLFSKMAAQSGAENFETLRSAAEAFALEDRRQSSEE